ncbi:membrane protein insertase YidC [Anianabacter salinae]|uniref:membrane protein insertase YidC n=1 Tax=Anianabacter salinae TaxID=2851023 RepID=UPI00225DF5A1|nr:membrane protein insertase YidC [Anianabacter salinae]MBV0913110.1 membrane protein insertase YidC [Anianabacter salinae]
MDDQNKNLILATALSFIVIVAWFLLFPPEQQAPIQDDIAQTTQPDRTVVSPGTPGDLATSNAGGDAATEQESAVAEAARITIDTPRIDGSISLAGGRIDDVRLKDYRVTIDLDSPEVQFLRPVGQPNAYYALFGWAPGGALTFEDVPGATTEWSVESGSALTPETPVTIRWDSPTGLIFRREIAVDDDYLFTVTQTVENTGTATQRLAPYALLARHGEPEDMKNFFILHEGLIAMTDGELTETSYDNMTEYDLDDSQTLRSEAFQVEGNGWIGFTDHYWMATLIPEPGSPFRATAKYDARRDIYRTEAVQPTVEIAPGTTATSTSRFFAGAKEWEAIRDYQNEQGIDRFVDAIDWGWFFFLTKPIFIALHFLNGLIGNMGWAIIGLTLGIKAILFPLAYKSYVSMAKMKELQPEMQKIKERAGDDRQKLQQETMALYKKERVNPASGCLPLILQIPIFFSLYKVIFVTLELRHAPWIGWINDLSAPDPSSILNLFGLLPFAPPDPTSFIAIISLGVLPILLGISMWLQQKLNPAPPDPTQAMIFAWMPWVFMFMLGQFASGLVLYWIANNTITFIQQYTIMRSQGYKPDVLGNVLRSLRLKKAEAEGTGDK